MDQEACQSDVAFPLKWDATWQLTIGMGMDVEIHMAGSVGGPSISQALPVSFVGSRRRK